MSQENTTTMVADQDQAVAQSTPEPQPIQITPRADIWEAEDAFVLAIEMPGVGDADAIDHVGASCHAESLELVIETIHSEMDRQASPHTVPPQQSPNHLTPMS